MKKRKAVIALVALSILTTSFTALADVENTDETKEVKHEILQEKDGKKYYWEHGRKVYVKDKRNYFYIGNKRFYYKDGKRIYDEDYKGDNVVVEEKTENTLPPLVFKNPVDELEDLLNDENKDDKTDKNDKTDKDNDNKNDKNVENKDDKKDKDDKNIETSGFIRGYPDGSFKPDEGITRAEIATILRRIIEQEEIYDTPPADAHWAINNIKWVKDNGYMVGYPDGDFKPDQKITRAEFIKTLSMTLPEEVLGTDETKFKDIEKHWAEIHIEKLAKAKLIKGYEDRSFKPDDEISRAEVVVILNRILRSKDKKEIKTFTDLPKDHWAYNDIIIATN